ncbi:MAG: hypothetical protein KJ906_04105 [Nanoarchaeota archaeon]|nr:hypothetical protein [Nanoarchaeota archaeon]
MKDSTKNIGLVAASICAIPITYFASDYMIETAVTGGPGFYYTVGSIIGAELIGAGIGIKNLFGNVKEHLYQNTINV